MTCASGRAGALLRTFERPFAPASQDKHVPLSAISSAAPIRRAIAEFDAIGRDAFLAKYGFGRSSGYMVEVDGRLYDSKPLLGAAHQWASPDGLPLPHHAFDGGMSQSVKVLERLGFTVRRVGADAPEPTPAARTYLLTWNPANWPWPDRPDVLRRVRDGESVAMRWSAGNTTTIPVGARVFLLRQGPTPRGLMGSGWATGPVERGAHWDPDRAARGERPPYVPFVFDTLLDPAADALLVPEDFPPGPAADVYWRPPASGTSLPAAAAAQLEALWAAHTGAGAGPRPIGGVDAELSAFEGARRQHFVTHRSRERSLRAAKLAAARAAMGALRCEVPGCGFDFEARYGTLGAGFAHVHHLRPLASLGDGAHTTLADLAVVCANCHAMIHLGGACRPLASLLGHRASTADD
jgi:hypothetical protein